MQLLERQSSLASLAGWASDARRGAGRLVLVGGEAGVGKTALVEQFQRDLADARWSWGACDGLFTPRPLGPLFDLADQMGGALLELCRGAEAREKLFRALLSQVSELGSLHVLVVEDVHWADEATIDLLRFLSRRIRDIAVLIIVTYRDDGLAADDPLRSLLGEIIRHGSTRRVGLEPLSVAAVGVLASGSGLSVGEVHRLTGGNPFYVIEVLQAGLGRVPESARDAVLARVSTLSGQGRAVLEVAALAGSRVKFSLVDAVTGCPSSAVDEVLASGLLSGDGVELVFRHEIARLAVEQSIAPHRGARIHARILAFCEAGGCDDARMAFHAERAGDGPAVIRYARPAAQLAAELGAHREAAAQCERALRFALAADVSTAAELYDTFAAEASLLGRWQEAADARGRARELWHRAGDRLREGDSTHRLGQASWFLGHAAEAAAYAETALAILEPLGPTAELAQAYSGLASSRLMSCQNEAAIDFAQRAQAIAAQVGLPDVVSDALIVQGCAAAIMGIQWTGQLRDALDIALAEGLDARAARAYLNIYVCYSGQCRFAEGDQYYTAGIAHCEEHDLADYLSSLRCNRASVLEQTGSWDEALALARELLASDELSPVHRPAALITVGVIMARRGEPGAWDYLDEAMTLAGQTQEPQQVVPARLARAEARWLEGDRGAALREAELAGDAATASDMWQRGAVGLWLHRTGSHRALCGDVAEPYRYEIEGDRDKAAQLWAGLGCPYDSALALQSGSDETALREALRVLDGLGAARASRITRQKMRRLGIRSVPVGPRSATRANPQGVTSRERQVLELICAGSTNSEIAERLFLSTRTVDHHVSAILAKLSAPSRGAAAARATALGIVSPAAEGTPPG